MSCERYLTVFVLSNWYPASSCNYLIAVSQVAQWCPDIKGHTKPLHEMHALAAQNLFIGVPGWMLSYWTCMASTVPSNLQREAIAVESLDCFKAFWKALDDHDLLVAEGGKQYIPTPGLNALVARAFEKPQAKAKVGSAIASTGSPRI